MLSRFRMSMGVFVVLLVLSILVAGCGNSSSSGVQGDADSAGNEVELSAGDDGKRIEIEEGQTLVVTLESNPSTGYGWEIVEIDETILKQTGEIEFKVDAEEDPPPPGTGGWEIFRLEATDSGEAALKLIYHRPWEEGVEPLETFEVQVVVR